MAVKIGDKIYRNEQEQVRKNMEDIEVLKGKIKDVFKTTATLTSSSVSVALVDTNVTDEEEGWLMSDDGLLFSITGNDGTNLLISYYSNLKGPEGPAGAALNIDDNIVSLNKVWSSSKTKEYADDLIDDTTTDNGKTWSSSKIDSLLSNGIAYTYTLAIDSTLYLTDIYIGGTAVSSLGAGDPKLKVGDDIIYVNPNDMARYLYRVTSLDDQSATITKICDFSLGKTLYQHNITINKDENKLVYIKITNDSPTAFTGVALYNYLREKGFTGSGGLAYQASGYYSNHVIHSINADSSNNIWFCYELTGASLSYTNVNNSMIDTVIAL